METMRRKAERKVGRAERDAVMGDVFGGEIHAQRVASLGDGVDGVLHAASLGVRAIGPGLTVAHGLAPRHAIKQVARLLSNPPRLREDVARCWVRVVIAARQAGVVNVAWTEGAPSDPSMIVLGTQTAHGRSPPLVWQPVTRAERKGQRQGHEDERLGLLADGRPHGVQVTVVADRGFSDIQLYRCLTKLGVESIMRVRGGVSGASAAGARRNAQDWLGAGGRRRGLRGARGTAEGPPVPSVMGGPQKRMKEPWLLARSRRARTGTALQHGYSRRFPVDETFRDGKNPRLGLGLQPTVMARRDRRAALFLRAVLAPTRLTRLGKAGEERGMERGLGATRPRQYSRSRQGQMLFALLPTMEPQRLRTLLQRCGQLLRQHVLLSHVLGSLEKI